MGEAVGKRDQGWPPKRPPRARTTWIVKDFEYWVPSVELAADDVGFGIRGGNDGRRGSATGVERSGDGWSIQSMRDAVDRRTPAESRLLAAWMALDRSRVEEARKKVPKNEGLFDSSVGADGGAGAENNGDWEDSGETSSSSHQSRTDLDFRPLLPWQIGRNPAAHQVVEGCC